MSEQNDIDSDEEEFAENTLIEAIEKPDRKRQPASGQGDLQQADPGGLRA